MAARFTLEHLVCEVPAPMSSSQFLWYEIDLDNAVPTDGLHTWLPGVNVIGSTRGATWSVVSTSIERARDMNATHVQFESSGSSDVTRSVIDAIGDHGMSAIPARHLDKPPSETVLRRELDTLAACATSHVKIAFPAPDDEHLAVGLSALAEWPDELPQLSLTPMGGRHSRLAAALAGSRLVFAPLLSTAERMSAFWLRALFEAPQREEEPWVRTS